MNNFKKEIKDSERIMHDEQKTIIKEVGICSEN
jgi:hypothetical protein